MRRLTRQGGLACLVALILSLLSTASRADEPPVTELLVRLTSIAAEFDADHNHVLSPEEQKKFQEHITARYGGAMGERLGRVLRQADADGDGSIDLGEWNQAIARLRAHRAAAGRQTLGGSAVQPQLRKMTKILNARDGTRLATDVYVPAGEGPFPVILMRTPYGRATKGPTAAVEFNRAGYVCVIQDMRGRYDSTGENQPFSGCGWGDKCDGAETVAWLLRQSFCNGKIGTVGGAASGISQYLLAAAATEGVAAQYITFAAPALYDYFSYPGGALRKCQVEQWLTKNRFNPGALELMLRHPDNDKYWQQFDAIQRCGLVTSPAVHVGGWFDTFSQGTIDAFVGRQHHGGPGARGRQKLVMGPWDHGGWSAEGVGELIFPNSRLPADYESLAWFDCLLKGVQNGALMRPAAAYYVMGDVRDPHAMGNRWRFADDWPPPARVIPHYLHADGTLSLLPSRDGQASLQYTFDPADPCPTVGGCNLFISRGPRNQNSIEGRQDVLLFTSAPLKRPLEVTGRVRARIFIEPSTADTDLSLRLCDVYPDGTSYLMAEGMLRLRHRNSAGNLSYHGSISAAQDPGMAAAADSMTDSRKPSLLVPGEVVEVEVDCWSTSIAFSYAHRVRLTITSSNYPRFDVNPGTGMPWADGRPRLKQTNRIWCDAKHPSCLLLPVIDGPAKDEKK